MPTPSFDARAIRHDLKDGTEDPRNLQAAKERVALVKTTEVGKQAQMVRVMVKI